MVKQNLMAPGHIRERDEQVAFGKRSLCHWMEKAQLAGWAWTGLSRNTIALVRVTDRVDDVHEREADDDGGEVAIATVVMRVCVWQQIRRGDEQEG